MKIVGWCLPPLLPPGACAPPQDLRAREAKNFTSLAISLTISFSSCRPKKALLAPQGRMRLQSVLPLVQMVLNLSNSVTI